MSSVFIGTPTETKVTTVLIPIPDRKPAGYCKDDLVLVEERVARGDQSAKSGSISEVNGASRSKEASEHCVTGHSKLDSRLGRFHNVVQICSADMRALPAEERVAFRSTQSTKIAIGAETIKVENCKTGIELGENAHNKQEHCSEGHCNAVDFRGPTIRTVFKSGPCEIVSSNSDHKEVNITYIAADQQVRYRNVVEVYGKSEALPGASPKEDSSGIDTDPEGDNASSEGDNGSYSSIGTNSLEEEDAVVIARGQICDDSHIGISEVFFVHEYDSPDSVSIQDHRVELAKIMSLRGTVRGVKNRVRAGIATFLRQHDQIVSIFKCLYCYRTIFFCSRK